jgi:hypothetical protein
MGLIALFIATGAVWSKAQAADLVVGSWRLVSWVEEEIESKAVDAVFGDNPIGVITYTSDGRMSLFIANPKRKPGVGPKATDAEAADLYRTMIAYSGAYSIDGRRSPTKSKSRGTKYGAEPINSVLSRSKIINSLLRRRQSSVR